MRLLPVASGKGGVGKSLLAANIAIALGRAGKRVVLVDLDLGGSNLHTILGMRGLARGVGTFLSGRSRAMDSVVYPTDYTNVRFIPGDSEMPGLANVRAGQKNRLIRQLRNLDAEFLVLDLGSGSNYNTVDFFLAADPGIIVATPALTSILNAYLFLKNAVFRLLMGSFSKSSPATARIRELRKDPTTMQRLYVPRLVEELSRLDSAGGESFRRRVAEFHPAIILNQVEDPRDSVKAGKIRRSCEQYLGLAVEHLGIAYRDVLQESALASGLPIVVYKPETVLSRAIVRISDKILESDWADSAEYESAADGYQTADAEAELDLSHKIESMQDLLNSGALTEGDLVETVRTQQYEIGRLRRESALLQKKLLEASEAGFRV